FRRRGYGVPAVATTVAAMRAAAQAAPAGLAAVATKAGLSTGGAASATGLCLLIAKFMALTKTQTAGVCVVMAAMPVVYQWHNLAGSFGCAGFIGRRSATCQRRNPRHV